MNNIKKIIILAVMLLLLTPSALAAGLKSWDEVEQTFSTALANRRSAIEFSLSGQLLSEMKNDNSLLYAASARAGCRKIVCQYWSNGKVEVTYIEPFDSPFSVVRTKEEIIAAVSRMRDIRAGSFVLVTSPDLFSTLKTNHRLKKMLLTQGGLYHWGTGYTNESYKTLRYEACEYWYGAVREADSEAAVLSAANEIGRLGFDAFALFLDQATYESLTARDSERLHALMTTVCVDGGVSTNRDLYALFYDRNESSVFTPGYVILRAALQGNEDSLNHRMRETLQKAREMTAGIMGTPRETALAIHDLLCGHITYHIDDLSEEDDCCIGAILNGKANCDGYSDAFFLLCGLKGIDVKLVVGDALETDDPSEEAAHMWNLILLDGVWRGVDVTWDDDETSVSYGNWNMGEDRMKQNYAYLRGVLPKNLLTQTDLTDRPFPEYRVSTEEDLARALRTAAHSRYSQTILWLSDNLYSKYRSDQGLIWKWMNLAGVSGNVSHSDGRRELIVTNLALLSDGISVSQADTESGIISLMSSAASQNELHVYCSQELFSLFNRENSPVWKWMDLAGITGEVSHSNASREIIITDISPLPSGIKAVQADSEGELIILLSSTAYLNELRIYCSPELYTLYSSKTNPIWRWIDLAGITGKVSHSNASHEIIITDISPLPSDVKAAQADSESEIVSQMRSAVSSSELHLYCTQELFACYMSEENPIWKWLDLAGISGKIAHNSDQRKISITEITQADTGLFCVQATTSDELIRILRDIDRRKVTEMHIYCSKEMYQIFVKNRDIIWDWLASANISNASVRYTDNRRIIYLNDIQ